MSTLLYINYNYFLFEFPVVEKLEQYLHEFAIEVQFIHSKAMTIKDWTMSIFTTWSFVGHK